VISHLDGMVCAIAPEGAVIEVGGVGLLVQCTPGTLATLRPGERARVATSLVVREDALTLYGFVSDDERDVFELAQTASGVGPRLALAMLASFSPDGLRQAIAAEDVTALTRVPGIGRKGAQRIVLELAGRLGSPGSAGGGGAALPGSTVPAPRATSWRDQVHTGLVNLGWPSRDAEQAIAAVEADLAAGSGGLGSAGAPGASGFGAGGDGARPDGAPSAADGAQPGAGEVDVAQALRAALRKLSRT
jgi:Holliday junction DNA helicase RuvA